ncbi:RING finger protein 225-like [Lepisosteus oculatus]|uniref:RING finger protein 225-like n=1 Tax=Lepisosteus oculatus TaxID=7918 RepID=UPI00371C1F5D
MDLLIRILSALHLDCIKGVIPTGSPQRPEMQVRGARPRASSSGASAPSPAASHCQSCISFDKRLKRLSCGHTFCCACSDRIVNEAFQDIEGLSDFPCPMCRSICRLNGLDFGTPPPPPPPTAAPAEDRPEESSR